MKSANRAGRKAWWKWPAAMATGLGVFLFATRKSKAAVKPAAKPVTNVVTGTITFAQSGSVTETVENFATGVEYKKTWTKAEWDKRTAALNAGDPYMADSWKRQSEMTDDDWARWEARNATVSA